MTNDHKIKRISILMYRLKILSETVSFSPNMKRAGKVFYVANIDSPVFFKKKLSTANPLCVQVLAMIITDRIWKKKKKKTW